MPVITKPIVVFDAATRKHIPLAAGDQLPGNTIQLSTAAGNGIGVDGTGGLFVSPAIAALPDNQVLTGDPAGTVALTLTPSQNTADPSQTDYLIKADVKVAAAPNALKVVAGQLVVAPNTTTSIPTLTVDDGSLPTTVLVGTGATAATLLLGNPLGFANMVLDTGVSVKVPYYA